MVLDDGIGRTRPASSTMLRMVPLLRFAEEDQHTPVAVTILLRLRRRGTARSAVQEADRVQPLEREPSQSFGSRLIGALRQSEFRPV